MARTALTRTLERRLQAHEGAAEAVFWEAFRNQSAGISEAQFRRFLQDVGRPLTWRLWNVALDELDRLT